MADEQFKNAEEAFDKAIDALLENLNASDDDHLQIVHTLPRLSRAYRDELRRTATKDTGQDTDLNEVMADALISKVGFLLCIVTQFRQRRGLSMPDDTIE